MDLALSWQHIVYLCLDFILIFRIFCYISTSKYFDGNRERSEKIINFDVLSVNKVIIT